MLQSLQQLCMSKRGCAVACLQFRPQCGWLQPSVSHSLDGPFQAYGSSSPDSSASRLTFSSALHSACEARVSVLNLASRAVLAVQDAEYGLDQCYLVGTHLHCSSGRRMSRVLHVRRLLQDLQQRTGSVCP